MGEVFMYVFGINKCFRVELLPDRYVKILPNGKPTPIEDWGDYLLTSERMEINEAFLLWYNNMV